MGRGTWQAMFHRVTQSWTWLGWLSTRLDPEFSLLQYLWLSKHFQFFFFHPWNPRQLKLPFPNHQRHLKLQKMLQPWHLVVFSWLPSGLGGLVQSELKPVLLIIVLTALSLLCLNCLDFVFLDAVVFQLLIRVWFFATPWTAACQASLSFTVSWNLLKLMSIESVMSSNHLILCHPRLFLPSIFPSFRVFSDESALWIRWPKYWSFSFNISPSNEHPGLI